MAASTLLRSVLGIDIDSEQIITPAQAARHPLLRNGNGKPCHLAKVFRLFNDGARAVDGRRVRLEFIQTPSGRRTSIEALRRFAERLTCPSLAEPATTSATQRRAQAAVDRELDAMGIK